MKQKLTAILFAAAMFTAAHPSNTFAQECAEHQWEWHVTDEPTCTFDGMESRRCENCYEQEYRSIPATGHQWEEWVTVEEPTCEYAGLKSRQCTVCHYVESAEIPVTEKHSWEKWETEKKATALSEGTKVRYCEDCDKKETKSISKLKAKISLKEKSATIEIGKSHTLEIKSKTYGDKVKEWTSSNKNVAATTSNGKVSGKQAGVATITLKMESGAKATCKIRVTKPANSSSSSSGSGNSYHSSGPGSNSSTGHVNPPASGYVWIPNTGSKYHRSGTCGRMKNPRQVPLQDAINAGYEPCSKCS